MNEIVTALNSLLIVAGAASICVICGAAFAFGAILVCQWKKWAPINLTVTINDGEL